jgi:hypothetical protein
MFIFFNYFEIPPNSGRGIGRAGLIREHWLHLVFADQFVRSLANQSARMAMTTWCWLSVWLRRLIVGARFGNFWQGFFGAISRGNLSRRPLVEARGQAKPLSPPPPPSQPSSTVPTFLSPCATLLQSLTAFLETTFG